MPQATRLSQSLTDDLTVDNDRRHQYAEHQAAKKRAQRHRSAMIMSSGAVMSSLVASRAERR
jgi:hypothetical protein